MFLDPGRAATVSNRAIYDFYPRCLSLYRLRLRCTARTPRGGRASASLTNDDMDLLLLGVSQRPFMADVRTPKHEAEGRRVGGIVEVYLLGLHLAVVHNPHLLSQYSVGHEQGSAVVVKRVGTPGGGGRAGRGLLKKSVGVFSVTACGATVLPAG